MGPRLAALAATSALLCLAGAAAAPAAVIQAPGLDAPTKVLRDKDGVPHVFATTDRDAYFAQGWTHAADRLFQMDSSRRQASGTLAELLGSGSLAQDVQLRTLGLRRAAVRSLNALSPETQDALEAYADGVNAWVDANALPPEYDALELTSIPEWTPLDSVAVGKLLAFGLSFDSSDTANTERRLNYAGAGFGGGFNGTNLFLQDMNRSEPFAQAPSILPGEASGPLQSSGARLAAGNADYLDKEALSAASKATAAAESAGIPTEPTDKGSNIWVVSDEKSASGNAMVANDPHLALGSPSTFYEIGLDVDGPEPMTLFGVSFPGAPGIVQGTNGRVSWGSTVNPTDVTDFYGEQLVVENGVPVATKHASGDEPTQVIPQTFKTNQLNGTDDDVATVPAGGSVPAATIVVPRRGNGPLVSITGDTGVSVQYTGFGATREFDFFRLLTRADDVEEAIDAQRYFDVGAQNWMYADDSGNIGYKTSAEIPLRQDLQNGSVSGLPPYFVRNGFSNSTRWIPDPTPAEDQASEFEILPFEEMDGLVNPARGYIANANQDPTGQTFDNNPLNELRPGGGIRYITPGHADGNRNARITQRIEEALATDGTVSMVEMQSIQADVKLNDAIVLVPYIVAAFRKAQKVDAPSGLAALGDDPGVVEAVDRLRRWNRSTPTGIAEGYDAQDKDTALGTPSATEINNSVATTIYSLWRSRALALFVDAPLQARGLGGFLPPGDQAMSALRNMLEGNGTGASGIKFFTSPRDRDTKILQALRNGLDRAASADFAPAFNQSTNQDDYRWGYLHRITFRHPLGPSYSFPTGAGFDDLQPDLAGVSTDGGFAVVDASSHNPRANSVNGFTFGSGPARRFVAEARDGNPKAVEVIPGGESGGPWGPWFGNQLGRWLTNGYHPVTVAEQSIRNSAVEELELIP